MSSKLTLRALLAAVTLAALPLCASGAPLEDALTDSPARGESSGEEKEVVVVVVEQGEKKTPHLPETDIFETWDKVIKPTAYHQEEFKEEFHGIVEYNFLDHYKHPSFPVKCPASNSSKEACLQSLAQGLLTYLVLLKHVEKEYPNRSMLTEVKASIPQLVTQIKMKESEWVEALTSPPKNLLKELDNPDTFTRKMTAYSILSSLHFFLIDCKRSYRRWEEETSSSRQQSANE